MIKTFIDKVDGNFIAFHRLEDIVYSCVKLNKDIFSVVASWLFNEPYNKCFEYDPVKGKFDPEGARRRNVAKQLLLNRMHLDVIESSYNVPDLKNMLLATFPYTNAEDIDSIEISFDQKVQNAWNFAVSVFGYVDMLKKQMEFENLIKQLKDAEKDLDS